MRVGSRIVGRDAYRVEIDHAGGTLRGLVPEEMMDPAPTGAPRHQPAYEWLARHARKIEAAMIARSQGRVPRAPFDRIEILED